MHLIPAQAGIHLDIAKVNMGPRLRGDDEPKRELPLFLDAALDVALQHPVLEALLVVHGFGDIVK